MMYVDNYPDIGHGNQQNSSLPSLSIVFYMILLTSSVAGQKLISIYGIVISAGNMIFQISYMLVVCITELYGLKQARKIIITGALCNLFVSCYLYLVVKIPGASFWLNQDIFSQVTLVTSNILFTSTVAYVISEIANAKIISKLKVFLNSRWFLIRAIFSTSIASILDTTFMLPVIISHSSSKVASIYSSLILIKIVYSIALIPVLWILVEFLRKKESLFANDDHLPFSSVSYMKHSALRKLSITD